MSKTNVQLLFTDEEYKQLEAKANALGLTVSLYIKASVLGNNEFIRRYSELLKKVEALQAGTKFNIRMLFGVDWTMDKGIKLNLGRTYYKRVMAGDIDNVIVSGKDSSNVMWYERK